VHPCEVADEPQLALGLNGIGIDFGLKDQIACAPKKKRVIHAKIKLPSTNSVR
jgi:hypothetical protein